ncbi:4'-phosphopantetheinyl transferase superfamily protein [Kitasatospora sp. NPDC097643]|uniref:4'-phosphopantetheinyl transferase family protein n=1 Tax=Kitasatospora sp. NPDC097643 TaxID=3157230 RepID=UPI003324FC3F
MTVSAAAAAVPAARSGRDTGVEGFVEGFVDGDVDGDIGGAGLPGYGLGTVLPAGARWAEAFGAPPDGPLLGPEVDHIAGRSPRRRRQFTAARTLARRTLAALGHPPVPLLPGPGGAPGWPVGIAGSITHCDGYTACATARTTRLASLGIDAEPAEPLPRGVLALTASEAELGRLEALPAGQVPWDRLLFSAKEATYKAWFPLDPRWTGLATIEVELGVDATFTARHPHDPVPRRGRWTVHRGIVLTALAVPARGLRADKWR